MGYNAIVEKINNSLIVTNENHPLKKAHAENSKYFNDFISTIIHLSEKLTRKQIDELLYSKLKLNQSNFDLQSYFQAATEITVLSYFYNKFPDSFLYEPRYNNKKNPECSVTINEVLVNIEVKCPNLEKRWSQSNNNDIKLFVSDRIPNYKSVTDEIKGQIDIKNSEYTDVRVMERLDNKVKDFLLSAEAKFPKSKENVFNILVICLDNLKHLNEWYNYLFSDNDGVLTSKTFVNENYVNVDAILLTDSLGVHLFKDETPLFPCWNFENCLNLLLLSLMKENSKQSEFFKVLDYISPATYDFFDYLKKLDSESDLHKYDKLPYDMAFLFKFADYRITGDNLIAGFVKYCQDKHRNLIDTICSDMSLEEIHEKTGVPHENIISIRSSHGIETLPTRQQE